MGDWQHAGNRPDLGRPEFCVYPSKMVNVRTGEHYLARCGSTRASRCEPCSELHRGDVAAVGRSGWTDRPSDRGYWCALTAPGADVLPWDRDKCTHSSGVECSGSEHGCVVDEIALALWHDQLALSWSHFIHDLRRLLNPGATGPVSSWPVQVDFHKSYEPQARGALHAHFMIRVTGVVTDRRFRAAFKLASSRHSFGRQLHCEVVDLSNPETIARKAGYMAKYAAKCADVLLDVVRLDRCTGEIKTGGLRSWSASRRWGDSMATVKMKRCTWAAAKRSGTEAEAQASPCADGGEATLDLYQHYYASMPDDYDDWASAVTSSM